jgi:hypothetical protein
VLPSDCDGVESRKTFVLYRRRGGQKVNINLKNNKNIVQIRSIYAGHGPRVRGCK